LNAFYSVWGKENDNSEQENNIIESITGKGKLRGTEDKDQFTFNQFELFKRENADKIIGYNASHGDTIGVSTKAFPSLEGYETISFASTNTKEDFRMLKKNLIILSILKEDEMVAYSSMGTEPQRDGAMRTREVSSLSSKVHQHYLQRT